MLERLRTTDVLMVMRGVADAASVRRTEGHAEWARRFLDLLVPAVGADRGWLLVGRGVSRGGQQPELVYASSTGADPNYLRHYAEAMASQDPRRLDPMIRHYFETPGVVVSAGMEQVLLKHGHSRGGRAWAGLLHDLEVSDIHAETARLSTGKRRVFGLSMHRLRRGRFTNRQRAMIRLAVTELAKLVETGGLQLPEGTCLTELPPRQRMVLDHLLIGEKPAGIADAMGISLHTVREHQKRLYRHFGVAGRDELMAFFLGK